MSYETILYELDQAVATITFNRPQSLNAFNNQMIAETTSALKAAGRDDSVRCVVMTGSGRAFSSGQDLKAVQSREGEFSIGEHLRSGFNRLVRGIVTLEKPVKVRSQFQPVNVTGIMEPGLGSKNLFFVDGSSDIPIGYTMRGIKVDDLDSGGR